jgi:hypothetical protein
MALPRTALADLVAYRRDRRKDQLLQENGYLVLRYLAEDLAKELDSVLDGILRSLSSRRTAMVPTHALNVRVCPFGQRTMRYSMYRRLLGIEPIKGSRAHAGVERSAITLGITSGGGRVVWRFGRQWVATTSRVIFGTEWENPANLAQQRIEGRKNDCPSAPARGVSLASFLLSYKTEHHVFRAVAFSVVMILAIGPNAALLCTARCHPQAAATSACHHEKPSAASSVMGVHPCDDCNSASLSAVQFLREDVQRSVSALDADHAILVRRYQLARSTSAADPGQETGRTWWLEKRPLPTALRI